MAEPNSVAQDTLRGDILAVGVEDFVSMAAVVQLIDEGGLADSASERHRLVVDTVRSLLDEGLIEVGVISSASSSGFATWPGTVEDVMVLFIDRFVAHYDDRYEWAYKIWLNLTEKGRQASAELVDGS